MWYFKLSAFHFLSRLLSRLLSFPLPVFLLLLFLAESILGARYLPEF
jgi:hypothetical protein